MKKICLYIIAVIGLITSCSPDKYDLGNLDVKPDDLVEGIAFKIEHDATNPNIVYLTSLMDSKYAPLWNHPQGRSQEPEVTLRIPFEGVYEVQFGVQTRGGIVYGKPVTFNINDMYAGFIEDPLWTMLTGGTGKSKTWYLDLNAEGVSKSFKAPLYFFTGTYSWDNLHTASGENYIDASAWDWTKAITPLAGEDGTSAEWYWLADWPGNKWMCAEADFGSMTFDLIGGANVVVDQNDYGLGYHSGSFMIDVENHTISFTDAIPLHVSERNSEIRQATGYRILYMTDDFMQIMSVPSGTCYNYISREYSDNWTPGEEVEPEPELPEGWQDDISQTVTTSIKWVLSTETPFNWANLDGSLMNDWNSLSEYPDWTGFDASIPDTYSKFSLSLDSKDNSVIYIDKDGEEHKGSYTLDEKGIYTFSGITPTFNICGWVELNTSDANQWRITRIEKDEAGIVTGMWVGVRDAEKAEYMVYHLVLHGGSALSVNTEEL